MSLQGRSLSSLKVNGNQEQFLNISKSQTPHLLDYPAWVESKWCLNNLIAFSDKVIGLANERKAVDIVHFDFSRASDIVSHYCMLEAQRLRYELDKWIIMWVENQLDGQIPRTVISGNWLLVTSRRLVWGFPVQERYWPTEVNSGERSGDGQEPGAHDVQRETAGNIFIQPAEEEASGVTSLLSSYLAGWYRESKARIFSGVHGFRTRRVCG